MRRRALFALAVCSALLAGAGRGSAAESATIAVGGTSRSYLIDLPAKQPAPLVLILHGNSQRAEDMVRRTSWPEVARREQFVAVYPEGNNRSWADFRRGSGRIGFAPPAGTDDVAFLSAIVAHLIASGAVNRHRVYITGVSNGGAMTMTMICEHADLFAAAASVIFNLNDTAAANCHPARPVPMLMMNGTADPLIPYAGGKGTSWFSAAGFWSTARTFAFWKEVNGCGDDAAPVPLPDRDPDDGSSVTRLAALCPIGDDVVLYRIDGGGHRLPGAKQDSHIPVLVDRMLGPQNHDIDGAETIWQFFRRFTAD